MQRALLRKIFPAIPKRFHAGARAFKISKFKRYLFQECNRPVRLICRFSTHLSFVFTEVAPDWIPGRWTRISTLSCFQNDDIPKEILSSPPHVCSAHQHPSLISARLFYHRTLDTGVMRATIQQHHISIELYISIHELLQIETADLKKLVLASGSAKEIYKNYSCTRNSRNNEQSDG